MKKTLLIVNFMLMGGIALAQNVGINTENPTETLHLEGRLRATLLPDDGQENVIFTKPDGTASNTKDQTFNAEKVVVVDKNGVFGKMQMGSWGLGKIFTVDATSSSQTVDLTNETNLKGIYVIKDQSTGGAGYSIKVNLPENNTANTTFARVFRVIVLPTRGGGSQSIKYHSTGGIGNFIQGRRSQNAISFTPTDLTVGGNSPAKYRIIYTFIELDGKWYLDEGFIIS